MNERCMKCGGHVGATTTGGGPPNWCICTPRTLSSEEWIAELEAEVARLREALANYSRRPGGEGVSDGN